MHTGGRVKEGFKSNRKTLTVQHIFTNECQFSDASAEKV